MAEQNKEMLPAEDMPVSTQVAENVTPVTNTPASPATLESVSADLGVPIAPTPQVTPQQVFSANNIQQATTSPAPKPNFAKMSADELAREIASARNDAELRQIDITGKARRLSTNVGEGAQQSRLDTAQINALSGLLSAKEAKLLREEQIKQQELDNAFREKQLAISGSDSTGTWSATTDSDGNSVMLNNKTGEVRPMGSVTVSEQSPEIKSIEDKLLTTAGIDTKVDPQAYLELRNKYASQGLQGDDMITNNDLFDKNFSHLLSSDGADYVQQRGGITLSDAPTTSGGSRAANIADDIMSPTSTTKLSDVPTKLRPAVSRELEKLKQQALNSGDIVGIIQASAGGKDVDATFLQSFEKGVNVLGQIEELAKNVENEATGPLLGIIRGNNPYDTKAQEIEAQLTAIVPNLARGIYGEVGVLTDNDVKLYSKTLPNLKSTEDVRDAVLALTMLSIQRSLENKIKTQAAFGRDVSGVGNIYSSIEETVKSIESRLSNNEEQKQTAGGITYSITY